MERLLENLLQRVPINQIQIPDELNTSELVDTLSQISEINPYYARNFLSSKLPAISSADEDGLLDIDPLYQLLGELITSKPMEPTSKDLIVYPILDGIKIYENPNIISGQGTTGFRTWEASLFLSEYLANHKKNFSGSEQFLELGSGTGIVGITLLKLGHAVILTDGDSNVLSQLPENLKLNKIKTPSEIQRLWWTEDEFPQGVDVIVGADITYDSSIIVSLVSCIKDGFINKNVQKALIAATARNVDTLNSWEAELTANKLEWEIVAFQSTSVDYAKRVWYQAQSPDILLYEIRK